MQYIKGLAKKKQEEIFKLFRNQEKLKFNQIEKSLKIRSNELSYYLSKMQSHGLIKKKKDFYVLSEEAEQFLPAFSNFSNNSLNPLPVILVAPIWKDKILLIKRNKRPYKNYWALIGGKMLLQETLEQTAKRLVKEKSNLKISKITLNEISHERLFSNKKVKNSFILFFTKAKALSEKFTFTEAGELKWFSINEIKEKEIVPSDYWLIKNKLNSKIEISKFNLNEKNNKLSSL